MADPLLLSVIVLGIVGALVQIQFFVVCRMMRTLAHGQHNLAQAQHNLAQAMETLARLSCAAPSPGWWTDDPNATPLPPLDLDGLLRPVRYTEGAGTPEEPV